MASVGFTATVKASGAAVPVVAEACTGLGGGVWQVTNTARRIWDPAAAITVKDGGVAVGSGFWAFDYLFGKITFTGYAPAGAVTVDGSYLPTLAIAEVRSVQVKASRTVLDKTSFDSGGAKQKVLGLVDGGGSFEAFSTGLEDLDAGVGGTQSLWGYLTNGTPKLIEANFGSGALYFRGWVLIEAVNEKAAVDGLVTFDASFVCAARTAGASLGFGT